MELDAGTMMMTMTLKVITVYAGLVDEAQDDGS